MLEFKEKETKNVESLLKLIAENQSFGAESDKLSALLDKFEAYADSELSETELEFVTAAVKPHVPKYKMMKDKD